MSFTRETGARFETSDNMPAYMKSVHLYEILSKEEEIELGIKIQAGCEKSIHRLVCANLRYVVQQANKFIGQGVSIDDLINEGNEALLKAVKRYDPKQNKKFITFAHFYLQKAFNLANGTYGKIVRIPQNQEYDIYKRRMAGEEINTHTIQLDKPVGENGDNCLGDLILKTNPNESHDQDYNRFVVTILMRNLDTISKTIIEKRFGMSGEDEMTLKEISAEMELPQDLVTKKFKVAIKTMQPNERTRFELANI